MMRRAVVVVTFVTLALAASSCLSTAPRPATPAATTTTAAKDYPTPDVPASLTVAPEVREQHLAAWRQFQSGDARGASRVFSQIVKKQPAFYPARAAQGFVQLAAGQYKNANARFSEAIAANDQYLPAWIGQSDALLGLHRDADAIAAMQRVLALDPKRDAVRTRLELLRFRLTQSLIESARRAKTAKRLDDAEQQYELALQQSPQSTMILHELSLVEVDAKKYDEAEQHARRATEIEPRDAEWQAALGAVLETRGQYRDASVAYSRAAAIDPRPEWKTHSADLREKAELAALPEDFMHLPQAPTITRADVAAFVGIRLEDLIEAAPRRITDVATDVRTHWAAPWIVPVTRAGVMSIYPNHTFQPAATVRRADLASVVAALVRLVGTKRPADLQRWQAVRPRLTDVPATHVSYRSIALAVAAGAMSADSAGQFDPARPASGADLDAAVRRISQLSTR
jgi:tetratricopeptide (TPR) repeat protein